MSVAIVTNSLPDVGQGKYAYELHKEMAELGFDAELLYLGRHFKDHRTVEKVSLPRFIEHIFNYELVYPRRIGDYELYHLTNEDLSRLLRHKEPSVITIHDFGRFKGKGRGGFLTKSSLKLSFNPQLASRIITISEYTRREFLKTFDVPPEKIMAIHLGVGREFRPIPKDEARDELELNQDSFIILNVGPESKAKRTDILLKAFSELEENAVLARVGKKSSIYDKLIERLGIEDRVVRPGSVPLKELSCWYSAADIYLDLDTEPGFGLPVLESMACGTTVMCSNEGAFPEIVGDTGILVEPTAEVISSELDSIAGKEGLRKKLAGKGMERAENFSWRKTAERTIEIYEQVLVENENSNLP